MLINKIIEEDTKKCHEAMQSDTELLELEKQLYAYLQGIKDFTEMCGILRDALYPSAINLNFSGNCLKCLRAILMARMQGPTPRLSKT